MVGIRVKSVTFERAKVMGAVRKGAVVTLGHAGGYIRRVVLSLLHRNKKSAFSGSPPSIHSTGIRSLTNIQYAVDPAEMSVVIGPPRLSQKQSSTQAAVTVPNVTEFGGSVRVREVETSKGTWRRANRSKRFAGKPTRTRTVEYDPHPFMGPALAKAAPKLSEFWKNAVVA